jgi:hypothetical protein
LRPHGGRGGEVALRVTARTAVTVDGRAARSADLRPGADVRAAYRTPEGGRATAISVEQLAPAPAPAPPPLAPAAPRTPAEIEERPLSDG